MVSRISDGKVFAADYDESANDTYYVRSPFQPVTGSTVFREVVKKTRVVTEEYYEYL
jgi:hypothetical protein